MAADMTLREISDRLQINDLLIRYTTALDSKDWKLLDTCFTSDAHLDYTSAGGVKGAYPEVREWLQKALAPFATYVHYVTNSTVTFSGDEARARTAVLNPMGFPKKDGSLHMFTVGAYYNDRLVRTPEGWRIAERIEESAFLDGTLPEELQIPK